LGNHQKLADIKTITTNRRARHDYHIVDTYEAGIALEGMEVKSLREGKVSLQEGYARVENGEVFLYDVHISHYSKSSTQRYDPKRRRKLLLNKREIRRLFGSIQHGGFTLVPLSMYFNDRGLAKVSLALARGKHLYDKREDLKKESLKRDLATALKGRDK
jgi:SsrA-binding protein